MSPAAGFKWSPYGCPMTRARWHHGLTSSMCSICWTCRRRRRRHVLQAASVANKRYACIIVCARSLSHRLRCILGYQQVRPPPQLQSNCQYNSKKEGTQKRTTGKCQAITMDKWKNKRAALFILVCSRSAENAQKNEPGPLSGRSVTCGDNRKPSTIGSACASLRLAVAAFAFCVNEIAAQVARLAKLLYCAACAIVAKALQKLRRAAA